MTSGSLTDDDDSGFTKLIKIFLILEIFSVGIELK